MVRFIILQRSNGSHWQYNSIPALYNICGKMGCVQDRPPQRELLDINGVFIPLKPPTTKRGEMQEISIEVKYDESITDTLTDNPNKVLLDNNRLVLTQRADQPQIQRNILTPKLVSFLIRAHKAHKKTLVIHQPVIQTDDPLIRKSAKEALFREIAIALADFASQVDFRSLKYAYFDWEEDVKELHGKVSEEIRSMRILLP